MPAPPNSSPGVKVVFDAEGRPVELPCPKLAALLSWLVPGLGHMVQGRRGKGLLFMICILGTFIFGLVIGEGKVAYASTESMAVSLRPLSWPFAQDRWPFLCQAGIGGFALPALVQSHRAATGQPPLFATADGSTGLFYPPGRAGKGVFTSTDAAGAVVTHPDGFAKWNYDLGYRFEFGTMFTVIAGLLNILAVYDAHDGPLVLTDKKKKTKDQPDPGGGQQA